MQVVLEGLFQWQWQIYRVSAAVLCRVRWIDVLGTLYQDSGVCASWGHKQEPGLRPVGFGFDVFEIFFWFRLT